MKEFGTYDEPGHYGSAPKRTVWSPTPGSLEGGYLVPLPNGVGDPETPAAGSSAEQYIALALRALPLAAALGTLGALAGLAIAVTTPPSFRARALLEFQVLADADKQQDVQIDLNTNLQKLRLNWFQQRVADRILQETMPPVPVRDGIVSKLRNRFVKDNADPVAVIQAGVARARSSFDVRTVNGTRLLEVTSDSTHPAIAAAFVNTLATEYIEQSRQDQAQTVDRTNQVLHKQVEEAKARLNESEAKLQRFMRGPGSVFLGSSGTASTLSDTKAGTFKSRLADIEADRLGKQSKWELIRSSTDERLVDILDDPGIRGYQRRVFELRQERTELLTTLTENHVKVRRVQAQLDEAEQALTQELQAARLRVKTDYEEALKQEKMLSGAYGKETGTLMGQSETAAEYDALRRETEILRQTYSGLIQQANQAGLAGLRPTTQLRLIEPATPPASPYKPRPENNILLGTMAGLIGGFGFVFLRDKLDRRLHRPAELQTILNTPEVAVIPSVEQGARLLEAADDSRPLGLLPGPGDVGIVDDEPVNFFVRESFHVSLASLMRPRNGVVPKVIMVASPRVGEGKTFVVTNLGSVLAETGRRVVMVDCDFRRPQLHLRTGLPNDFGVNDFLDSLDRISAVGPLALPTLQENLFVLPNGTLTGSLSQKLNGTRFRELISRLRREFDVVLLDVPPILDLADTRFMMPMLDGVVLVVRAGQSQREDVLAASQELKSFNVPILGRILNDWKGPKREMYHYRSQSR